MFCFGFWFYEELATKVGTAPGKHRGDKTDSYMDLETPTGGNFMVKTSSLRLELFRQNPKCVACERIGMLWILEAHHRNEPPHLNLYHVGEEIQEWKKLSKDGLVMMTKDHITLVPEAARPLWKIFKRCARSATGRKAIDCTHNNGALRTR